jgi:parallel beta-helix repeat protein
MKKAGTSVFFVVFFVFLILTAIMPAQGSATTKTMYWTDWDTGKIQRANPDGTGVEDVVSGLSGPGGIAIDVAGGKMYWCDYTIHVNSTIKRANLDGSGVEVLVTNLHAPRGIALDIAGDKMYWSQTGGGTNKIQRANLDGSDVETLLYGPEAGDVALNLPEGKIYWPDARNQSSIRRSNLDGTDVEIVISGLDAPMGIALDKLNSMIYWTERYQNKIIRAKLDGTSVEVVITAGPGYMAGIALDLPNGKVYWTNTHTDKIRRANLDGTGLEDLVTTGLLDTRYITIALEPEPITLLGIEIVGPEEVPENFSASYRALAYYSTGSRRDVTDSTIWSVEPDTYATIDDNGLLRTKDIETPEDITIYAECTIDDVTFEAEMMVQIILSHTLYVPSEYETIQTAIDNCVDGDVVIVAPRSYTGEGNRDIDFLGKAITVRSTNPEDPNIVATTIIDCQNKGCGFYFYSGENSKSVLDGFTITNGYGSDSGGGVYCWKSNPKIINCNITGNRAKYCGGGMFNNYSNPTLINCNFSKNHAPDRGGAIWCHSGSSPHLTNCRFIQNSAGSGGAISGGGSPTLTNCTFTGNSVVNNGGAIHSVDSSPRLTNCTFSDNSAERGGGLYSYRSNPILTNCILGGNEAQEGPEIHLRLRSSASVSYTALQDGQAAIYVDGSSMIDWGKSNIDADPCFADPCNGDYRLLPISPCIDAGDKMETTMVSLWLIWGRMRLLH